MVERRVLRRQAGVALLLLAAGWLRLYHLEVPTSVRADENLWFQSGTSLLRDGVPSTWTIPWPMHAWASYWRVEGGVVAPWLDHPPLFSLLVGSWARLLGYDGTAEPSWYWLRLPMVAVAVLTLWLTYLFAARVFGETVALFSLAGFTFYPASVIASRFVLPENVIPLLLVAALCCLAALAEARGKARWRWLALLLAVSYAAPLLKLSGLVVPGTAALFFWLRHRHRLAMVAAAAGVLSVLTFLAYAWWYEWAVFIGANAAHLLRPRSFSHFWSLFFALDAGNFPLLDPTIIVGLIMAAALMARERLAGRSLFLFAPWLVLSFLFLVISPVEHYSWYKYSFYPLAAIGVGFLFSELHAGRAAYLVLFLPWVSMAGEHSGFLNTPALRTWAVMVFYTLALWPLVWRSRWLPPRAVFLALLALLFFFEAVWVRALI